MVAAEADFDIEFVEYPSALAVTQAIRDGTADMLAGVGRQVLEGHPVAFAGPVAETPFLLFVRGDAPQETTFATFDGTRIGAVRNTAASLIPPPEGVEMVVFDDQISAFAKLLNGDVDGVIALSPLGMRTLRKTGLDSLIRPSFPAIRSLLGYVALRQEHADLLPDIEQAIERLEANRALPELRRKWFMVPAVPIPDVLTVGVTQFPPYSLIAEDGSFSGFAVEVIRELADRANIALKFEAISQESWAQGPRLDAFDLLPARSATETEAEFLQFTNPIQTIDYLTFVRAEDAGQPLTPATRRVGILASSPQRAGIARTLGTELIPVADTEEAVTMLGDGNLDAVIFPRRAFEDFVTQAGKEGQFARLSEPAFQNDLSIALRPGLGDLRERLNVVIQGFIGSGQYRDLATKWLEKPQFWTPARVTLLLYAIGVLMALAALGMFIQNWRARKASDRLRSIAEASNSRLAAVLSSTSQAVFGFGGDGSLAIANPSGRRLLGLDPEEPARWPEAAAFIDPGTGDTCRLAENDGPTSDRATRIHGQACLFRSDPADPPRYVRVTSDTVRAPESGLASIMIVEDDHVNEMNRQKLDRSMRLSSLGMLTGGLAHDFNNVLGSILFNAEMGQMGEADRAPEILGRIIAAVDAGRNLTERLLAFSRDTPQDPRPVNVGRSFQKLAVLANSAITEAISLDLPTVDTDFFIFCDVGELENAMLNLIINARDALQGSGVGDRITVRVRTYDSDQMTESAHGLRNTLEISVSDNGPGMSAVVKRHATDPFYTTKKDGGGSGLGLSMVAGFVDRASGDLSIYSEPGQGTTVRLRLPQVNAEGAQKPAVKEAVSHGSGQQILLVEDQIELREPLVAILMRLGYEVEDVDTGVEAIARLESGETFDLVLSDIVMPGGVSGGDLAQDIAARFPGLPIILMSGHANIDMSELRSLDVPVLQKPAPVVEIARAIADVLASCGSEGSGRPKGAV
ncbi:Sensor histidine kinase RcsC [Pseudooceanicola algae]|uniref:histidine kinase n=2 Tax=Pseudooceanicola algae TaxID=1537215 RepID=A0A418SEM9_9RHOB|nr:Sensor histidine kinase RcsC [Pseudooceanicola algae]